MLRNARHPVIAGVLVLSLPVAGALAADKKPAAKAPARTTSCQVLEENVNFFRDEGLAIKVSTKIQFTKVFLREKVAVKVNGGVVTLSGNVSTANLIGEAGRIASQVSGVRCVNNLLKVGAPIQEPPPGLGG